MKKIIYVLLYVFILFGFNSCQRQSTTLNQSEITTVSSTVNKPESYSICLIADDYNYCYRMQVGCKQAILDLNKKNVVVDFTFQTPDISDDSPIVKYEEIVESSIDPLDVILLTPNNSIINNEVFKMAEEKGIKTILLDQEVSCNNYWNAAYMSNYYNDGVIAARELIMKLKAKGIHSGKICLINLPSNFTESYTREESFKTAFENTNYELMETFRSSDPSNEIEYLKELVKSDEWNNIVGIVGFHRNSLYSIPEILKTNIAYESKITVLFDVEQPYPYLTDDLSMIYNYFETGAIDISINTDPYQMGYQGLMGAVELLRGNEIDPKVVDIPSIVVTKDNYEEYFKEIDRQ